MLKIELLKDHPHCIPALARIWYDLHGKMLFPDLSIIQAEEKFKPYLNEHTLPLTLVALEDDQPVGMCSLRENGGIESTLSPWASSRVVASAYQKQGIGRKLLQAVLDKAKDMGFKTVYAFILDPKLVKHYQNSGWEILGSDEFVGHHAIIMKYKIA